MFHEEDPKFYNSSVAPGWIFKSDTSSDEITGHLAAYPMLYDAIAQTEEQKARVLTLMEGNVWDVAGLHCFICSKFDFSRQTS